MITEYNIFCAKRYCRDDITKIKGYERALTEQGKFHIHHLNEWTFTRSELIAMNMYYHRPADELQWMSHSEHRGWHNLWNGNFMKGKVDDLAPTWKGEHAGVQAKYKRGLRDFRSGKITEEELQPLRDAWIEYKRVNRNGGHRKCVSSF